LGAAPECQREALRQIDFFFDLNVFGFDSVADDLFRAKSEGQGLSIDLRRTLFDSITLATA
jgi:hypothetical protein